LDVAPDLRQSVLRSFDLAEIHALIWRAVDTPSAGVAA
jgi:hypothetical protein